MSMKSLETAILLELKEVAKNDKLRLKDIMEWQTGNTLKAQEGETLYYLPRLAVSCAVKVPVKATKPKKVNPAPPTEAGDAAAQVDDTPDIAQA